MEHVWRGDGQRALRNQQPGNVSFRKQPREEHKEKGRRENKNVVVQEGSSVYTGYCDSEKGTVNLKGTVIQKGSSDYKGSSKNPGLIGFQTCLVVHGVPNTNFRRKPNSSTLLRQF